jgi:hypothetical protein
MTPIAPGGAGAEPGPYEPRLMAQWAAVPGDIAQGSHSYEGTLMETADRALSMLQREAAKEGKRLRRPVMCRVTVEAYVEDE